MKAGIHPNYKKATVKCACGNEFETGSVKELSVLKLVLNAIHSIQDVKNSLKLAVVLIDSTKNTVLNKKVEATNRQVFNYACFLMFSLLAQINFL